MQRPVSEGTGPTLTERGWNQGHPPVSAILPKKSLRTALEWEEVCSASNRHFHVSRYHRSCREGLVAGTRTTVRQPPDDAAAPSRRGLLKGLRHAQTRKGAARRPRGLADGGHRHQPRSRDASHRGRHRGAVTHGIRDQRTQPPITAPRPVRASTPGRAFS